MTFNRRYDITLTQMAQWVDSHNQPHEADQATLLEYLYHLVYSKVEQNKLFTDLTERDDFTLFCVSRMLTRYKNETAAPIKSAVNYITTVLEPWKAEYIRCFCGGSPDSECYDFDVSDFGDYLIDSTSYKEQNLFNFSSFSIQSVVGSYLRKIPKKRYSAEWSNIYTSCVLTLLDRIKSAIQLSNKAIVEEDPKLLTRVLRSLKLKPPILFHLSEEYATYITVLVNELTHAIAAELTCATATPVTPSSCLKNLVIAANNNED